MPDAKEVVEVGMANATAVYEKHGTQYDEKDMDRMGKFQQLSVRIRIIFVFLPDSRSFGSPSGMVEKFPLVLDYQCSGHLGCYVGVCLDVSFCVRMLDFAEGLAVS